MSTYLEKITKINTDIFANAQRKITGPVLNVVLKYMLDPNAATIDMIFNGTTLVGNVYTKIQVNTLLKALSDRITILENASISQFVEEEAVVVTNMITGGTVKITPSELLNKNQEYSLYYNGVFLPKSIYTIDANNILTINLTLINVEPKVGDAITLKYYKQS